MRRENARDLEKEVGEAAVGQSDLAKISPFVPQCGYSHCHGATGFPFALVLECLSLKHSKTREMQTEQNQSALFVVF